jgi:DNA-binding CsgD family transcriptional regulator
LFDAHGEVEYFLGSQVEVGEGSARPLVIREQRASHLLQALSARQREVLREMAAGHPNKQIAWRLSISEKTVKMHRGLLLQKLSVRTSADAIRLAVEAGL